MRGVPSSSPWRAAISAIAKSSENGSIGGALDHIDARLLRRRRGAICGLADLRQTRIKPRNRIIELARNTGLAAALGRLRKQFDLPCNGVEPLVDFDDIGRVALRQGRTRGEGAFLVARACIGRVVARGSFADGRVQPVAERHAGTARRSFGPLANRWLNPVNTPRYARIHALVRFRA
jgi:hypothetical protein